MSSQSNPTPLEVVLKKLQVLASLGQPGLSPAADAAVKLCDAVKDVQTDKEAYLQLAQDAAELLYVVPTELKVKGVKIIDGDLKRNFDSLTGILQRALEKAEINASLDDDVLYFSAGDAEILKPLKEELQQRLQAFGIQSFAEVKTKARELRIQSENKNRGRITNNVNYNNTITNHGDHNKTHVGNINQGNGGVISHETNTGPHLFNRAHGFNISGGEFNNVGGNINKTEYNAKNLANNYGTLNGQNVGDGATINFTGLPR